MNLKMSLGDVEVGACDVPSQGVACTCRNACSRARMSTSSRQNNAHSPRNMQQLRAIWCLEPSWLREAEWQRYHLSNRGDQSKVFVKSRFLTGLRTLFTLSLSCSHSCSSFSMVPPGQRVGASSTCALAKLVVTHGKDAAGLGEEEAVPPASGHLRTERERERERNTLCSVRHTLLIDTLLFTTQSLCFFCWASGASFDSFSFLGQSLRHA